METLDCALRKRYPKSILTPIIFHSENDQLIVNQSREAEITRLESEKVPWVIFDLEEGRIFGVVKITKSGGIREKFDIKIGFGPPKILVRFWDRVSCSYSSQVKIIGHFRPPIKPDNGGNFCLVEMNFRRTQLIFLLDSISQRIWKLELEQDSPIYFFEHYLLGGGVHELSLLDSEGKTSYLRFKDSEQ